MYPPAGEAPFDFTPVERTPEAIKDLRRRRVPPALRELIRSILDAGDPAIGTVTIATDLIAEEIVERVGEQMLNQDVLLRAQLRGATYAINRIDSLVEPTEVGNNVMLFIADVKAALERALQLVPE